MLRQLVSAKALDEGAPAVALKATPSFALTAHAILLNIDTRRSTRVA